jgi:hypothetical protein
MFSQVPQPWLASTAEDKRKAGQKSFEKAYNSLTKSLQGLPYDEKEGVF